MKTFLKVAAVLYLGLAMFQLIEIRDRLSYQNSILEDVRYELKQP